MEDCILCRVPTENRRIYNWTSRERDHLDIARDRRIGATAERTDRRRVQEADEQVGQEDNPPENPASRPTLLDLPGLLRAPNTANSIFQHCSDESEYPRMNELDLFLFALGVYQLKQAKNYYGEHILDNESFRIELGNDLPDEHLRELQEQENDL
ncbi:unnamed protein product [Diatraea saccharalis]|uniref:Uncharacterized protein n=1 Tax=Diatraea saccharalis TaxID=40085 RepID=A0A9N9WKV8_9NEOP|nr:unnamed protein product [Diatraea saccharalis]